MSGSKGWMRDLQRRVEELESARASLDPTPFVVEAGDSARMRIDPPPAVVCE